MKNSVILLAIASLLLVGCATSGQEGPETSLQDFQQDVASRNRVVEINDQLMMKAVEGSSDRVYRVGAEDRIRINIFGVDDLSREYRVNGAGNILLPLVGEVAVSGLTLSEVESVVADAYAEEYLKDPQVSAEVTEFRSKQFTVIGAVANPRVYSVSRQTTLIEALAMAGGISGEAGSNVYLTDRIRDPETGQLGTRTLIVDVQKLMQEAEQYNMVLGEGAMINVPRGGYVYVEGAVNNPGAYRQRADSSVLKILAQAGGLAFEADKSDIRVMRRDESTGGWKNVDLTYNDIRQDPEKDLTLGNGDIVIVENSAVRTGIKNFVRFFQPFAMLGFRPL